jgi:hypothetical protein
MRQTLSKIRIKCRDGAMFGEFSRQERSMSMTYLTTDELSAKIKYDVRTIRERLKDSVLLEGTHYVRPFGGRKILFVWEAIERDMRVVSAADMLGIPMASGAVLHV